jgi:hypothetical protein
VQPEQYAGRRTSSQARIGAPGIAVVPIVAVVGAKVAFGQVTSMA